jgi:hypothetical protein
MPADEYILLKKMRGLSSFFKRLGKVVRRFRDLCCGKKCWEVEEGGKKCIKSSKKSFGRLTHAA